MVEAVTGDVLSKKSEGSAGKIVREPLGGAGGQ